MTVQSVRHSLYLGVENESRESVETGPFCVVNNSVKYCNLFQHSSTLTYIKERVHSFEVYNVNNFPEVKFSLFREEEEVERSVVDKPSFCFN